jgi:hypothetical protein
MPTRSSALRSIADTIADYRSGEIEPPNPRHVGRWVSQFHEDVQDSILVELDHVLKQTYLSKVDVQDFLRRMLANESLAGSDPCAFWGKVEFLRIQGGGNSQRDMLQLLHPLLLEMCGFGVEESGMNPDAYVYLDDVTFTGNRVLNDMAAWIRSDAPSMAKVYVLTIALHRSGHYYASTRIQEIASTVEKDLDVSWWRGVEVEDRKTYIDESDVLRPTTLPDDQPTQEYVKGLRYPPVLRRPGHIGEMGFFSSEEGRHLLEQELLKAGVRIRSMSPYLNVYMRPLGNMVLETLGFGSLLVTFRNCPNNCPLALWAGDPWYPLFPRKIN